MVRILANAIAVLLATMILSLPTFAGQQKIQACNKRHKNSGHGCFQCKIVEAYEWWTMGPARKPDNRKDDLWLLDRKIFVYFDNKCTKLLECSGSGV